MCSVPVHWFFNRFKIRPAQVTWIWWTVQNISLKHSILWPNRAREAETGEVGRREPVPHVGQNKVRYPRSELRDWWSTWKELRVAVAALSYWPNWFGTTWICLILKVTHPVASYASMAAHAHLLPVEQRITQREIGGKLVRVVRRSETDAVIGVVHILIIWFVCLRFGVCRKLPEFSNCMFRRTWRDISHQQRHWQTRNRSRLCTGVTVRPSFLALRAVRDSSSHGWDVSITDTSFSIKFTQPFCLLKILCILSR